MFSVRGFEALFPLAGTLGCLVYLAPQLFLQVYLHTNVGLPRPQSTVSPGPPAAALSRVLSAQLPLSAPPTSLDECFFFNSLVVGLPCSLIFCQFWLVFVLEFVVVFLLVVQGSTVCLPMPPSWPEVCNKVLFLEEELEVLDGFIRVGLRPWQAWLSGLCAGLQTKGLPVWFPVRAHASAAGQAPWLEAWERQPVNISLIHCCFLRLFLSPFTSLQKQIKCFKKE